jgi:ubiquitin
VYKETLPACPNCKAAVASTERVYKVVVEPEQGERGVVKRDVGMYRCPRCDTTFPRVLGRIHYLLVPETEFNRIKKDAEENKTRADELELSIDALKKEKQDHDDVMTRQLRDKVISSLESELGQLEKHVKHLQAERDRLKNEIAAP